MGSYFSKKWSGRLPWTSGQKRGQADPQLWVPVARREKRCLPFIREGFMSLARQICLLLSLKTCSETDLFYNLVQLWIELNESRSPKESA